jgi:cohesin complex subunit SA-1/2
MLSDTSAPTRHEVIKQLEKIMKMDNIGGVRDFIERFRPRIVEVAARDSEVSVRASAVDLLDMIRKAGMLEPDDIDTIGKLIFDSEARVRNAVVPFFAENINDLYEAKIDDQGGEETLEEVFTVDNEDHESPRPGWIKLKCLAEVLLSYDSDDREESPSQIDSGTDNDTLLATHMESRFSLAAKALFDKIPEMRDWESLACYLLFDHSNRVNPKSKTVDIEVGLRNSFKLDEREEMALLEVLDAVVKLSLDQPDDHDKAKEKPKKKKSARLESVELQESIARRLALLIPRLLSKFGAKPKTAAAVLRLEQLLNLSVFQALRLGESTYTKLLHEIGVQFKGHADQRVLSEASAALLHARGCEELEDITEENIQSLWDDTVEDMRTRFFSSTKARFSSRGDLSVELLTELAHTVARVSKLASIMDPVQRLESNRVVPNVEASDRGNMVPIDIILELIGRGVLIEADEAVDDIEDQLAISACQSALFYFMWKVRSLQQHIANSELIPNLDVKIKDHLSSFSSTLYKVFSSRAGLDDLRLAATGTLLDVHVLFSTLFPSRKANQPNKDLESDSRYAHLHSLVTDIEPEAQEEITSIFAAVEKQYAKKTKKALEAPADDEEPEDMDSELEDEEDEEDEAERRNDALRAEQKLCELTGKIVLAILAGVVDASGAMKGNLRSRIQRNRNKLGANFKEILAYLDDPKSKSVKRSSKSKAQQATTVTNKGMKSAEVVDDNEEQDEDPFADVEPEEGTVEDLRRRELLDEEPPESVDEDGENGEAQGVDADDDDDIMGD